MMALMLSAVEAEARVNCGPAAILTALNQHFYPRLKSNHMNAALIIMLIDLESHTLQVANAGMVFPLLLTAGSLQTIEIGEFPLGSLSNLRYAERSLPFRPGDMVILQSDGVAEAHNLRGELFGFERMEATVKQLKTPTLEQVVDTLFASVASFTIGTRQHDDITVVAVQMT
jgi:sigma-B regulation protein RsbU (phosphoserine phosphatase)